jgi:hypothetical protein
MPERHGLPPIVKFTLLAFCGFLALGVVGVIVELGTALFFGLGDDPSARDEFFATTLTQARANGVHPHLTVVHDHQVYTYTRPTKNPNNLVLGSTACGALLVLTNDDHTAAALWRRLAEPPAER